MVILQARFLSTPESGIFKPLEHGRGLMGCRSVQVSEPGERRAADACREIFERWQGRHSLVHWQQSVLTHGQTKHALKSRVLKKTAKNMKKNRYFFRFFILAVFPEKYGKIFCFGQS